MTQRVQISVIGAAEGEEEILHDAEEVGRGIAEAGAVLVCGALSGVMEAASRGSRPSAAPSGSSSTSARFRCPSR
jgi:hypothetical protein